MVDVTPNANSGTFVDLSKLNTIDIGTEKEFKETLVKNNKINEPIFKQMTADEYVSLGSKFNTLTEAEKQEFIDKYNNSLNYIKIENNLIKSTSKGTIFAATMTLPAGKYKIVYKLNDYETDLPFFTDNLINNKENIKTESDMFNYLYFTDYDIIRDDNDEIVLKGTINISKDTKYYILGNINKIGTGPEITIDRISKSSVNIFGKENVELSPAQVSSYKDAGVSYNSKTLTGNDVFTYTNLKAEVGNYKYLYVVKTNQGVKKYTRYITVSNVF